jgi:hypothetical protein
MYRALVAQLGENTLVTAEPKRVPPAMASTPKAARAMIR